MAMLDEAMVSVPMGAQDISIDDIKAAIARQAWGWYYANQDDVIFSRRILGFWPVTIRVRDLHPLFIRLFGDPE